MVLYQSLYCLGSDLKVGMNLRIGNTMAPITKVDPRTDSVYGDLVLLSIKNSTRTYRRGKNELVEIMHEV